MAISFLDAIDLNGLEITNVLLQNSSGTPGSNLGGGQIVYDDQAGTIKYYDDVNNQWVELDGSGNIDSISAGDGIAISGTSAITVAVDYTGTNNVVEKATDLEGTAINGKDSIIYNDATDGNVKKGLVEDLPFTNNTGTVTSVGASNGTFIDTTSSGGTTPSISSDLSATGTPSATTFLRGDNVWATPAGAYSDWVLDADSGTKVSITDGLEVEFKGGTGIDTTVASGTPNLLTIDLADTSVTAGTYNHATITVDDQGRITSASSGSPGSMSSWILKSDSGSKQTISDGDEVTISGGTALTGVASATDTVTINHDNFGTAGTYAYPASIQTNAQGHVISVTAGSAPGTMSSFTLTADSGTNQTIQDGNTLDISGSKGIDTVVGATDTVTINLDLCELDDIESAARTDYLVGCIDSGNAKIALQYLKLNRWGTPDGSVAYGGQKITGLGAPTASTDAATKNYVDSNVAGSGALIYQGGYDASTAAPSTGVKKGFTYAVTTAGTGSPAGFWNPQLEVGDLIIANSDTPTSAADWTEVNKNIDVATATVKGIASFPTAGGLSVSSGEVSLPAVGSAATKGGASKSLEITTDAKGRVTTVKENSIQIAASQVTSFCDEVDSCVGANEVTGTIGGSTSMAVTHNLNTRNVMVEVYRNSSPYDTVNLKVERTSADIVTFKTAKTPAANAFVYMIKKII
ncbi:MAG: hypothetical protein Tp158DCM1228761_53 [Prokaryotic dsDNA virus sp.]|nr:MAG: hypothetical protein Tp158DCM1228761_53 [Prokaryotic dsDNA virus sp.]|tara:strand:- start:3359 stop:5434 length:2076 start_codon:yes stop_codon:yes gene_type:complete